MCQAEVIREYGDGQLLSEMRECGVPGRTDSDSQALLRACCQTAGVEVSAGVLTGEEPAAHRLFGHFPLLQHEIR